jgi:hypothetical protein
VKFLIFGGTQDILTKLEKSRVFRFDGLIQHLEEVFRS